MCSNVGLLIEASTARTLAFHSVVLVIVRVLACVSVLWILHYTVGRSSLSSGFSSRLIMYLADHNFLLFVTLISY